MPCRPLQCRPYNPKLSSLVYKRQLKTWQMSIGLSASFVLSDQKTLTGCRLNGLLHCKFLWEKRLHVFVKALPGVNCSIQNYLAGIKYNVFVGNRGCWYIGKKARRHSWHSLRHAKNIWYATKARNLAPFKSPPSIGGFPLLKPNIPRQRQKHYLPDSTKKGK